MLFDWFSELLPTGTAEKHQTGGCWSIRQLASAKSEHSASSYLQPTVEAKTLCIPVSTRAHCPPSNSVHEGLCKPGVGEPHDIPSITLIARLSQVPHHAIVLQVRFLCGYLRSRDLRWPWLRHGSPKPVDGVGLRIPATLEMTR